MLIYLRNIVLTNLPIKIISCILGYLFWALLSQRLITSQWVTMPLSFYNVKHGSTIQAPETIQIALEGNRTDLRNITMSQLAAHINANELKKGTQLIELRPDQLLLPKHIRMIHSMPSNIVITVNQSTNL